MSLLSKLWKKAKKSSQKSAKQAYKKKVSSEKKQEKRGAASTSYDKVRQKASPTRVNRPSGNKSGGPSSGSRQKSRATGWGAVTKSTTRPQNRQTQTKSGASGGWNTYAQNTFKSANKGSSDKTKVGGDLWKAYQTGKSLNALGTKAKTRKGGGVKSKDLTSEDYLKLQNVGRNSNLKLDNKTAYKVGSRTAYAANRNSMARASHGFMQGMAFADVEAGPGKYNKAAKKALKESRESTAGSIGYGIGQMAGFAAGGTSGMAKGIVTSGAKAGAKAAAKTGAKSTVKKFAKNRAAEMAVETPMNLADAVKMSKDENGKVDKKKLAGYMALNTGLTGGTGAIMEGAAIKFTKKNASKLIELQAKANKGGLTKDEGQQLKKLYDKLNRVREDSARADSDIANKANDEARQMVTDARIERRKAKSAARSNAQAETARAKAEADRQARTEAYNQQIDRDVKQWKDDAQAAKSARENERIGSYAENVTEKNRQYRNDRDLEARNAEIIENGGTNVRDVSGEKVPDTTKVPEGMKVNKNSARSAKKTVRETLGGKYTPEAKAEIHDAVDRMSNMINNGNMADARAEARRLAEKHGKVEPEHRIINHDMRGKLADAQAAIKEITFRPSDDALKAVNSKGRIKDLKEAIGDYDYKKVHIQSKMGPGQTGIDDFWQEASKVNPEFFPPSITDETERFKKIIEVSETNPRDVDFIEQLGDEEIEASYKAIADSIYDEAEQNAKAYKGSQANEIREQAKPSTENPKSTGGEDKAASAKAMKGTENARAEAENKMQRAKNAKRNKDVDNYVNKLESGKSDDPVIPDNPRMAEEKPSDVPSTAPTDVAEKTISDMREYSKLDNAFKMSSKNVLENAPDQADKVNKLLTEYKDAGADIAKYKKRIENNKNPKHLEDHKKKLAAAEERQKEIHNQMRKLEDTYVARYEDGDSVIGDINPTDSKGAIAGKTGKWKNRIDTARRLIENSLNEFEKVAKQTGNEKLRNAVNNVIYARNKAGAWIESGRSSFLSRVPSGKSLNQIFKDAGAFKSKEVRNDFNMYALLRHHIDRAGKDKPVFMKDGKTLSIPDAKKAMERLEKKYDAVHGVDNGKKKLEQFSDDLTAYCNDLLKYRLDAGLISKEAYEQTLKDYPHYVPTYRIKDGTEGFIYQESKEASLDSVIKSAKGGEAPIEDIYSQLHKMTNDVITNAEQNEMVKLYADAMGFKPSHLSKDADFEDLEKARIKVEKNGTISYFVDGQRATLTANEQAVKGLREWNGNDFAVYCNACAKIGKMTGIRIFKGLITDWNVAFGLRNGARDYQQALVNSKNTRWFFRSQPAALNAVVRKGNAYRKLYEASGGRYYVPSGNPKMAKDPTKMSAFEKFVAPAEAFNGAIEMMPRMSEFIGTINKEADAILKKQNRSLKDLRKEAEDFIAKNPPKDEADIPAAIEDKYAELICDVVGKDTVDRAMRNAADITLNFSRSGAIVKGLNSGLVPYLNPSIQGLSKTIRLFTEGKADKALLSIGAKLTMLTVAPSVANEFFLRNDRDYQDLNTRDKDTQFFIPLDAFKQHVLGMEPDSNDDGKYIKIPKPRENAVVVEPFTYGIRAFFDLAQIGSIKPGEYTSPENWKQMWLTAKDNIGPVMPHDSNYFSPLINTALNKTWYGGNIESVSDQKLPVRDRRDETTSALAIMLTDSKAMNKFMDCHFAKENPVGKLVASNLSPKKIDNLMDSYFGMIYDMAIKPTAANRDLGSAKNNIANHFMTQFIVDGVYSNKLADQYYTKLDKLNKGAKEGERTYKANVFMNDYGNQAMDYSSARAAIFTEDKDFAKLSPKDKQAFSRYLKQHQNEVYRGAMYNEKGIFGSFEDNFKNDPLRIMAKGLKQIGYEDKTGKSAEAKVLRAFTYTDADGKNDYADALDKFKDSDTYKAAGKEKGIKSFFNDTIRARGLMAAAGGSRGYVTWTGAALIAAERNRKSGDNSHTAFANAWGASEESQQEAVNYLDSGETIKKYAKTHKPLERMAMKEDKYLSEMDDNTKVIKLAAGDNIDTAYYIEGKYVDQKQNYGRCIVDEYGMTSQEYNKWMNKYGLRSYSKKKQDGLEKQTTKSGKSYYKSSEEDVINAIEKDYKDMPNEFKAAMYRMFYDYGDNPYGEVGDYSHDGDKGLHHDGYGGYGGRGRRRRGRRRGRRGYGGGYGGYGGGGGAAGKDWNTYVGEIFDMTEPKLHDYTKDSTLNDAYRRRAAKKQMINNKS